MLCLFGVLLNCSQCLCPPAFLTQVRSPSWGRCAGEMGKKRGETYPRKGQNFTMCDYLDLGTRNISLFTRYLVRAVCLCVKICIFSPNFITVSSEQSAFYAPQFVNPPSSVYNATQAYKHLKMVLHCMN